MSKKIPLYAWYFPNYHPDPRNEAWHGKGWTEWEVVKRACPRFEGHNQPLKPLWGYEDESDPKVMEKKIDTALKYGIDGFLWDYYWFNDGGYRVAAMDKGFLGAKNCSKFKFALMLCNCDAVYMHPAGYRSAVNHDYSIKDGHLSPQGFYECTQHMIKNYFWRDNYIRVNGKLLLVIWNLSGLIEGFGGLDGARMMLDDLRDRVRKAGLGDMYYAIPAPTAYTKEKANEIIQRLGIDCGIHYCWPWRNSEFPVQQFETYMEDGINTWTKDTESCDIPMNITVSNGWDDSPRAVQSDMYDAVGWPFWTIVTGGTPDKYEYLLRKAKEFYRSDKFTGDFITLSTWNEWTEGNYLEPSVQDGYAYLERVKKVFVDEEE